MSTEPEPKEERIITLALSPIEAQLVSVMFALGAAISQNDLIVVPALMRAALMSTSRMTSGECNVLSTKLINLDVEAKEGGERALAKMARRLTLGVEDTE